MNIIKKDMLDFSIIRKLTQKPALYEKSTHKFWDDPHIAQQMLMYHLNPDVEAASKTRQTIEVETSFIIQVTGMNAASAVIDLGCGPGLYVDGFAGTGARVLGVDLSTNSIRYAKENIQVENEHVVFKEMNYLQLAEESAFDIATLIFYDFCALSLEDQSELLKRIHSALNPGGHFVFDVFSEFHETEMKTDIECVDSGFWSPEPYWMIKSSFMYSDPKVEGFQYAIVDECGETRMIRVFHRLFSLQELTDLLKDHGFEVDAAYKNFKGEALNMDSGTIAVIARKV